MKRNSISINKAPRGSPSPPAASDDLTRPFRRQGRRLTVQRRAVLRTLQALTCAQTAEEIHRRARRLHPRVGLVTVYRTLDTLVRGRLVRQVWLGDGPARYEPAGRGRHHHHLVCLACGTIRPLRACPLPPLDGRRVRGFQVTEHALELFGYCRPCRGRRPEAGA